MAIIGGPLTGTSGDDILLGDARELSIGFDNFSNSIAGLGGNDIIIGDLYDPDGYDTEGDTISGGDGDDIIYGDTAPDLSALGVESDWDDDPQWNTRTEGSVDILNGNGGSDAIYGGGGSDQISGGGGADTLHGQAGSDAVSGGTGADFIAGGADADQLTGGGSADTFAYDATTNSRRNAMDIITDFNANATDIIDLAGIDALSGGADNRFTWRGTQDFTGLGQLRYEVNNGDTFVEVNTSGDLRPELRIEISGLHTLDELDFIL